MHDASLATTATHHASQPRTSGKQEKDMQFLSPGNLVPQDALAFPVCFLVITLEGDQPYTFAELREDTGLATNTVIK